MQASRIVTDESYKEIRAHGTADYPMMYYYEDIYDFDFHCVEWHWHPELELIYLEKGCFTAEIGSVRITVKAGEAVLINQNVLHRLESDDHAIIPNAVFLPRILAAEDSLLYRKFVFPVLESTVEYLHFRREMPSEAGVAEKVGEFFHGIEERDELGTVCRLLEIWGIALDQIQNGEHGSRNERKTLAQKQLQIMMSYIHNHYAEPISLEDIAASVSLSKSSILHIFQEYLHMAPVNYLIQYRLKMAADALKNSDARIDAIALDTGFRNTGYFCRKFKEVYAVTPSEYRNNGSKSQDDGS